MKQVKKRKTNLILYVWKPYILERFKDRKVKRGRYICHLEPKSGIEVWGFRGYKRIKKKKADVRSAIQIGNKNLFLVITPIMGKSPNLNSFRRQVSFS